jgi:sugar O-acyltransferase (sialic acid O-acetyltransferase NeuD family)
LIKSLLIIGAGGHGRIVADTAEQTGYSNIVFHDDRWPEMTTNLCWPVVGRDKPQGLVASDVFVAIGNNAARLAMINMLISEGFAVPTLVHPRAYVSRHAVMGTGSFVGPMAAVNAGAKLGAGVIVNTSATVDHDCVLGDGVHISPGAHIAGGVHIGNVSWIGIGACVRETIRIGARVMVGAGAAVVSHVKDDSTVMGVPARPVS